MSDPIEDNKNFFPLRKSNKVQGKYFALPRREFSFVFAVFFLGLVVGDEFWRDERSSARQGGGGRRRRVGIFGIYVLRAAPPDQRRWTDAALAPTAQRLCLATARHPRLK